MNGSIRGERTAFEPQDRSSSVAHSIEVPSEIIRKWQEFVNLLAEIMHVPSASIMRVDPPHIKVFVSSTSKGNPCEPGALDTGPYCETVMKTGQPLLVPDALESEAWKANPHVRAGMISYLGVPIGWPDGRLFGTICVRDNKRNEYSEAYLKLLLHFRDILQVDLQSLERLHGQIEEREAKIRRLVDANIIGIIIWDLDGRIIEANDAFLRMVDYDREDLVSGRMRWTDLTPPEWRDRDERRLRELKVTGSLQPFEKEYFGKDGSRVPVLIGAATFEEGGNQGVAFVLDLTERKRAEQAAEELALIVESSDDAIVSKDLDGIIRTWNRGAERLFGYKAAEVIGRPITILIPPDRLDEEPRILARIRRGERVDHYETVRRHEDGSLLDVSLTVSPMRDAKGAIVGASKIARDITERKRAEQALRESEAKLRDYAETASDWFWEIGPDYKFTLLTENAFGSRAADRIGTACWDRALDLEAEPEKWRVVQATLDSHKPFRDFVYRGLSGNGSPMYVKASGKPVFDVNGEFRGYRGTGTDVTALRTVEAEARGIEERSREAQLELAHANRVATMGQLTATITHEVNQPITAA